MKKSLKQFIFIFFAVIAVLTVGHFVLAQNTADNVLFGGKQTDIAEEIGLGEQDPRVTIANVIRVSLGILGILAVAIIIYAGWLWMTAGGNEEQIETAKKVLISAIVGLIIILSSFLIATFILNKLLGATGGGGGDDGSNTFGNIVGPPGPGDSTNPGDPDYPGAGIGAACATDATQAPALSCSNDICSSGFCTSVGSTKEACGAAGYDETVESCCLCQKRPRIDWVSPTLDGAPGNLVTIGGRNFGDTPGTIYFNDGVDYTIAAEPPSTVNDNCTSYWNDREIVVVIPEAAQNGPLKVLASDSFDDTTDNDYGPPIDNFQINDKVRPGVCAVTPGSGYFGDNLAVQGVSFNGNEKEILLGNAQKSIAANNVSNWTTSSAEGEIPNVNLGGNSVFVKVNNENSNSLSINVLVDTANTPVIDYIDPASGPRGQYITIYGSNFKAYDSKISKVEFYFPTSQETFSADGLDFPEECRDNWWRNSYVVVKVPETIKDLGNYEVKITNQSGLVSDKENFEIISGSPGPGICKLSPHNGPVGQAVKELGDNFGKTQGNGFSRFYNNKVSTIINWSNQKVDTSVPAGAETGPVSVANNGGGLSNSLPFKVGVCTSSDQCETNEECCLSGSFSGLCQATGTCAEGTAKACSYGWTFSTASSPDAPLTCSGFTTASACIDSSLCPNSPGSCQTAGSQTAGKGCGDEYCNSTYSQCSNSCTYDAVLNKCKSSSLSCDEKNNILISGFNAVCSASGVWQVNTNGASCPTGTFLDFGGLCTLGSISSPTSCKICPTGFSCSNSQCIIDSQVCPSKSTCDLDSSSATFKQCKTNDICECCCRVGSSEQDCCPGLTCTAGGCGSAESGYGLCTGCRVELDGNNSTVTSAEQTASNNACNCSSSSSRYCDLSDLKTYPNGVCADKTLEGGSCDADFDAPGCQDSGNCVSGLFCDSATCTCKKQNVQGMSCDSIAGDKICTDNGKCAQGLFCDSNNQCTCQPLGGAEGSQCKINGNASCTVGVDSCLSGSCLTSEAGNDCRCCCVPGTTNTSGLVCLENKTPCEGANRGLFCGCTGDNQCGNTSSSACGIDTCCRARPEIMSTSPSDGATNVCLNTKITATFNQRMDVSSFTDNVIVVGNYATNQCPKGTELLSQVDQDKGFVARLYKKLLLALRRVIEPVIPAARAIAGNFCAISGTVSGYQNADNTTTLTFDPSVALDSSITYYAVVKGDSDMNDNKNEGVLSEYGNSMNSLNTQVFNGVSYSGKIWSFTTVAKQAKNGGVCKINHINIIPNYYLFQTTQEDVKEIDNNPNNNKYDSVADRDKEFLAEAVASDGQILSELTGVYEWTWKWEIGNNSVIKFDEASGYLNDNNKQLIEAKEGVTDDSSFVTVTTDVSGSMEASSGESYSKRIKVWVFTCANPWPPINEDGTWTPWREGAENCTDGLAQEGCDINANYELYYCRDAGKPGTADDLPAILSKDTIIRGKSSGSEILKEFYFFREEAPNVSGGLNLNLVNQTTDSNGKIYASWNELSGVDGYKVYYGTKSGSYDNSKKVTGGANTGILIDNLNIGQTFYFTVTAYYNTGAESGYSEEKSIKVEDKIAPLSPQGVSLIPGDGKVTISWTANIEDTKGYKVYYGTSSGVYGAGENVGTKTSAVITGLTNGQIYYFAVSAFDISNNESAKSEEKSTSPLK